MATNAQILSALLNHFVQPIITTLAGSKLQSMGVFQGIENKIRSTGWVSGNWSMMGELAPFIQPITGSIVEPMLNQYLSQIPNEAIPALAHNVVDKAIENGELSIFEGFITFESAELNELKRLLNINMPITIQESGYVIKTTE